MITIKLVEFQEFEKVRVRLNKERVIKYKDNRKINSNVKTFIPLELINNKERKGIYIILKGNGKPGYVGSTTDLSERMRCHIYLKRNPNIKYIYFLEINNQSKRFIFEILYKFYYFKKVCPEYFINEMNLKVLKKSYV